MLGEVPVAIVNDSETVVDRDRIKSFVVERLGKDYALGDVVFLSRLGMKTFPLNPSGKVMKVTLKEALLRLRGHDNEAGHR